MIIEYVWKREIFTDPLLPPGCDVGWCDRASLGGGSLIGRRARYSDGGRGPDWRRCRFTRKVRVRCNLWRLKRGDEKISSRLLYWRRGGGPDWRRCWFIRKVRERCCIWRLKRREKKIRRTCYRLLGVPHTAPIGGWKSARERPLFQKKTQGIAEKACWRRRWHVLNRTMEWNFAFTLVFCRGGHWRTMIVERGLLNPRQREASGSSLFTAKVVSGTRLMTSVSGSLLHWGPDGARSAVDRKVMTKRNEFSKFLITKSLTSKG